MRRKEKLAEVFTLIEKIFKILTPIRFVLQNGLTQINFEEDELDLVIDVLRKSLSQFERLKK